MALAAKVAPSAQTAWGIGSTGGSISVDGGRTAVGRSTSFQEFNTTEFIADLLSEWDIVLFGTLLIFGDLGQALGWGAPSEFLAMIPYLATVGILVATSVTAYRRRTGKRAPAALGLPFTRGAA